MGPRGFEAALKKVKVRELKSADPVSSAIIPTCSVTLSQFLNLSELLVPALQNVKTLEKKNFVSLLILLKRNMSSSYKILSKCSL